MAGACVWRSCVLLLLISHQLSACHGQSSSPVGSGGDSGGDSATGGLTAAGGSSNVGGTDSYTGDPSSGPEFHPPPGFEDCIHAEVKKSCQEGWCVLPASCFVMGSPVDEWMRGRLVEDRVAVTLGQKIEVQESEMTRSSWKALMGSLPAGNQTDVCTELECPVTNVTWWDAVRAANDLSTKRGLSPCYLPKNCVDDASEGLACEGLENPEQNVQKCEGYRLLTRAEAEYAARAGTTTAFYTGSITVQPDVNCRSDPNLDLIAWYCSNSKAVVHHVNLLKPNGFGLYDLLGNVGEHLNDADTVASSPGGLNPESMVGNAKERVTYGGDMRLPAFGSRAASRLGLPVQTRSPFVGFRLARTLFEDSERSKAIVE